jgi:hypothetical protein
MDKEHSLVVEHLSSMHEVLSLIPTTTHTKKIHKNALVICTSCLRFIGRNSGLFFSSHAPEFPLTSLVLDKCPNIFLENLRSESNRDQIYLLALNN